MIEHSICNVLLVILIRKYNPIRGHLFMYYLIMYSVGRFFIEGMRTDSLINAGLKQAQLFSIILIVGSIIVMIYRIKQKKVTVRYDDSKI